MKKIIQTPSAPNPMGPYSQAVQHGNMLFISGQVAFDPANGELVMDDIPSETTQIMKNLKAILEAADMDFSHVVKTSIFLADINNFSTVNEVYGSYFDADTAPARETSEVANLPGLVNVEISMIAMK